MRLAAIIVIGVVAFVAAIAIWAFATMDSDGHEDHTSPTTYQITQCAVKGGSMIGDMCLAKGTTTYVPPL